jgi:hypothetical protein
VRRGLALVVAGLAAAGCGSSSQSARQFRQSATAVCRATATRAARIKTPTTPAGTTNFLNRGVLVFTPELRRLGQLHPPKALQADYTTALQALSAEVAQLRSAAAALRHGADPIDTTQALQHRLTPIEARGDAAWRALEIPTCASRAR